MSDIRLILVGVGIIFTGFILGGLINSNYAQFEIQGKLSDQCYDYSSGKEVKVKCTEKGEEHFIYFGMALGLLLFGGFIIFKGIRGKWDQNVKDDEMLGPKGR